MRDFLRDFALPKKPILIVGKGPSLDRIPEVNLKDYFSIGLNQVARIVDVDMSHTIHSEIVESDEMVFRDSSLLTPYETQVGKGNWKDQKSLFPNHYFYNLSTHPPHSPAPTVTIDGFSIHPVIELLAILGAKSFYTIGIDGGETKYANSVMGFHDQIENIERNKSISNFAGYNYQFRRINELKKEYGFTIDRLFSIANHG
jgi:hypothetical protein